MKKNYKQPEGGLLQSKEWNCVLRAEGQNIITVSCGDTNIFGVEQTLPIVGTYIYFPRINQVTDDFIENTVRLKYAWIRVDICNRRDLRKLQVCDKKIVQAPHNMQPKENLIIDIAKDESVLLAQMKSKTRYNIRLAQKKGVKVFTSRDKKYVDIFCDLVEKTAKRKGVSFHNREHYHQMFQKIPENMMQLYIAQYDGENIAANITSFYGDTATYLHGATSDQQRNVMAPFLLQWRAMLDATEKGCQWYDFGGIFSDSTDEGKKGITRFKKGFAPKEAFFVTQGSYDIILSQTKYKIYRAIQKMKNVT